MLVLYAHDLWWQEYNPAVAPPDERCEDPRTLAAKSHKYRRVIAGALTKILTGEVTS